MYKYLDVNGAKAMLYNSNIQFTNATKLNDPFDCHPGLIDFFQITPHQCKGWPKDIAIDLESHRFERDRDRAWLCCLSKNFQSILMWSYYNNDRGVCIGLNIEKIKKDIHYMLGTSVDNNCHEVVYRDIIEKPNYFTDKENFSHYQLTKAKEWAYEEEARMFIFEPVPWIMGLTRNPKKDEITDWKEDEEEIIKMSRKLNPNIHIYQMKVNPGAFKLDFSEVV